MTVASTTAIIDQLFSDIGSVLSAGLPKLFLLLGVLIGLTYVLVLINKRIGRTK